MSEQQLRDLLRRAVPDAPDMDPFAIGRRAARERRNKASVLAGGAAVLVIAAAALSVAELPGTDGARPSPSSEVATQPRVSDKPDGPLSPYAVPPCPVRLPDPASANHAVTDLADVVAVRLCPGLNPRGEETWQPTLDQFAQLEDADALVRDLAGFGTDLRGLPAGLPEYCDVDEGSATTTPVSEAADW